ncbi:putative TIR domain, P-loop containing nucleoside triphosphate hydrolase [Helianthus annuus]|nr:putative TIR domain, P-loop containing nucleoside triphosphate hydrolase [Helianthus annuus]KAJ0940510.1 putative TIR domain, P-loop containing nucleoside triphosphate hydrolase [Helianthus annuus]KAJ0952277.1 putative TIR domain, P-loop containing nucleoside triphosphate hydrolase [Helianthus annuus]
MDLRDESSRLGSNIRHLSSSSSVFFSANQSPFFSPRSSFWQPANDGPVQATTTSHNPLPYATCHENEAFEHKEKPKKALRSPLSSFTPPSTSYGPTRLRNFDVYIGFHGKKPLLLRFVNWLRADLEVQGLSCFVTDRAKCRNSRKHNIVEKAMDASAFGVIILTRKSFRNAYTIEELRFFASKKNLVPVYFDVGPDDCLVRDIVERRGETWERHGGELWLLYGGLEHEWKEAVNGLTRVDEWKLEARDGKWRDCILRAVTVLASRLGRRSVVDRLTKWRENVENKEFPYPRNENFIGRKKELSELEFMLFGDVIGDGERDYFELKARPRRKNLIHSWGRSNSIDERKREVKTEVRKRKSRKGKEPVVWKESEKEIEMQNADFTPKPKPGRRKRAVKVVYGKGIACVSGDSGIGKTELLLEFAYRFHQRYKMVLWIGGESRYIRQNYLNLLSFLEVDVGIESGLEKSRTKSFEEHEEYAISRIRKELMRDIPFLVIIDNLESEKDWWDHKHVIDLLPRFGGETHVLISTRLPRLINMEPLRLSYLSGVEAMSLLQGNVNNRPVSVSEIDALRTIEEKLGRLTLGLAIVGAVLSELPITPSRLLDTINRMPSSGREIESRSLRKNKFFLQLIDVCFSIFDHADGPRSLATRMVLASGWFAPGPTPVSLLALAAKQIPEKHHRTRLWRKILRSLTCGCSSLYNKKSETEACSVLLRFNIARSCTKDGHIRFNQLVKLYARKRSIPGTAHAVVHTIVTRGTIINHSDHIWAACFLLLGFGTDPVVIETKASELPVLVKEVILPLAIRTFVRFSRCTAALELLRLCTNLLEAADEALVKPVEKWLDKSLCWKPIKTDAQLNPSLWQDLALSRASVLEIRAKLMLRGGQFDIGDDLIRKAIFIRSCICGDDHPHTVSARETLSKLTRLTANVQMHTSP